MKRKIKEMNQRYIDYANYNIWANNKLINNLTGQDSKLLNKELVGSFPTIRATISHIWLAETGWLSRMNGDGWKTSNVTNFSGNNNELFKDWQITSESFRNFVEKADLDNEIQFEHKGEDFSVPTREIIQTVFNHGSYHRGQVVLMMRQLGISKISQTDYIEWVREKERGNI